LAEVFFVNQTLRRPFVALKVASTLDGFMALRSGESQWITGPEARLHAHHLRAIYDAVLVGARTFLQDNPSLNVRHPKYPGKRNKVILLDKRGDLLPRLSGSRLMESHLKEEIFVALPELAKEVRRGSGEINRKD